eukprot:TRINITY_DN36805_c0_g1_i1.p1 TRINITY_DN36805_c0_g1~~TRINITY_DN36805_c0_g1_i1.p1  ORF type:complete len:270 (-),score=32.87 TRINITY_DN36805_c0_g1_i1:19-804(-)
MAVMYRFLGFFSAGIAGSYGLSAYVAADQERFRPPVPSKEWNPRWDGKTEGSRRIIYLVRHGQYQNELEDDDNIKTLTPTGREQALRTGRRLKELGLKFSHIHCSTLSRAQETANLIRSQLGSQAPEIAFSPSLAEGYPCMPDPPHYDWVNSIPVPIRDKESQRIERAFFKYFSRPEMKFTESGEPRSTNELIVGHGNVIRYFVCRSLQLKPQSWLRMNLANCSITKIDIRSDGRVFVSAIGENGFLPPELITYRNVSGPA